MRRAAIYGEGHLAETLRAELALLKWEERPEALLGFAAQDVTDHASTDQMGLAHTAFNQAAMTHRHVVVLSQVPPGWTRRVANGRANVFYQVDTIIVKSAVARMMRPEQFIIGCEDPEQPLPLPYQEYLATHDCPVLQMSYESAEMAKLAINYMLAMQVGAARDLYAACVGTGADYDDVRRAMHNDARIGPHAYLRPGKTNRHLDRDVETITRMIEGEQPPAPPSSVPFKKG